MSPIEAIHIRLNRTRVVLKFGFVSEAHDGRDCLNRTRVVLKRAKDHHPPITVARLNRTRVVLKYD